MIGWRKLNGENIQLPILEAVEKTIREETALGNKIKVCIGTDSQSQNGVTDFATVIVFLRVGRGGFMYVNRSQSTQKMSIKERMLIEVSKSIEIAYSLCPVFETYQVALEIHADINTDPHFQSNSALKEAMGYIRGMGFEFKMKPDAFASSSCADKFV